MILAGAWVVPGAGPPIRDGYVEFSGARIRAIGARSELNPRALDADRFLSFDDGVIVPGLVNPHTHLELGCYAGRIPPADFWTWISRLVALRREPGQLQREEQSAEEYAWKSLRAGITCVGDISRRNVAWRGLRRVPIRKVCFAELLTIADDPPRTIPELHAALDEISADDLLHPGVSPHATWSIPASEIRACLELARERAVPWTIHLAETREETDLLCGRPAAIPTGLRAALDAGGVRAVGSPPLEYWQSLRPAGLHGGALAHVNYLDDVTLDRLALTGDVVVYCPRAHEFFGHNRHPVKELRRAGVQVAIGTDSPASNTGVGLLEELTCARRRGADVPPHDLFTMITTIAARALDLERKIGSLEPGKLADISVFPGGSDADPIVSLIDKSPAPLGVWVHGQRVV